MASPTSQPAFELGDFVRPRTEPDSYNWKVTEIWDGQVTATRCEKTLTRNVRKVTGSEDLFIKLNDKAVDEP